MKNKVKKDSIVFRFLALFIVAFVIPLAIFTSIIYWTTYKTIKHRAEQDSHNELLKSKATIEENILTCQNISTVVKSMENFIAFAKGDMLENALHLIQFRYREYAQVLNIKDANPRINSIRFYMDNPNMYEIYGLLYNEERLLDKEKLELIKANHLTNFAAKIESNVYSSKYQDEMSFFSELRDVTGHIGVLEVAMAYPDFFEPVFKNDANGSTVIFMNEDEEAVYNNKNRILAEDKEFINSFLQDVVHKAQEDDSAEYKINKKNYWISKADMNTIRGTLYQITSFERIKGEFRAVRGYVIWSILLSGALLLGIIQVTVRKMLGKLQVISQSISQVQSGNLEVIIPVKGKDEIDCLAADYNRMTIELKKMIQRLLEEQNAVRISEIKALQAQIHSHFIYNVLESVRMMAEINHQKGISKAVAQLGNIMRYSVGWKDSEVPLKAELQIVKEFVELMNAISDNSIELMIDVEGAVMDCQIPKMSIQPIVENSVNHGFEPLGRNGILHISGKEKEEVIRIEILDNGIGIETETLNEIQEVLDGRILENSTTFSSTGIGLANVNMRLKLQYGLDNPLKILSVYQEYTKVILLLPKKK